MNYTKGEWKFDRPNLNRAISIFTGDKPTRVTTIARMNERAVDNKTAEIQWNDARLIATAPKLYEALRGLLALCEADRNIDFPMKYWNNARQALAEARGKEDD